MVKLQCPSPILYINLASQQSCVFFVIFFVSLCAKCVCESTQPLLVNHAVVTDAVCIYCSLLKYAMASLEKRCHLHGSIYCSKSHVYLLEISHFRAHQCNPIPSEIRAVELRPDNKPDGSSPLWS